MAESNSFDDMVLVDAVSETVPECSRDVFVTGMESVVEERGWVRVPFSVFGREMDGDEELSTLSMKVAKEVIRLVSSTVGRVITFSLVKVRVTLMSISRVRVVVGPGTWTVCSTATVIVEVVSFVDASVLKQF